MAKFCFMKRPENPKYNSNGSGDVPLTHYYVEFNDFSDGSQHVVKIQLFEQVLHIDTLASACS